MRAKAIGVLISVVTSATMRTKPRAGCARIVHPRFEPAIYEQLGRVPRGGKQAELSAAPGAPHEEHVTRAPAQSALSSLLLPLWATTRRSLLLAVRSRLMFLVALEPVILPLS